MAIAKSIGAVVAGFLVIAVLSTVTDTILEGAGVLPKGSLPQTGGELMLLGIIAYRAVYSVIGCYVAAKLAPANPMKHALALGVLGIMFTILGAVAMNGKAPVWFSAVLVVITLPVAWLGGKLQQRLQRTA